MEFINWYVRRGRIGRRVFWLHYVLPIMLLTVLAIGVDLSFGDTNLLAVAEGRETVLELGAATTAIGYLTIAPTLSSQATRLHDQGRSAWWLLLNVVPLFGQLALFGICGFVPGQPGPNRYGPAVDAAAPAAPPAEPLAPWTPGPADKAPDYPPSDWR
ncbi:Uncharacterized membrane protein YhaH, DUF805 family [Klenkia soli]|uniref:Uncharacterized membrane protein YhaH, DUF805 family n=1 Tax=Klenkia soli TaxID=1052260 RepID=A0A1H0IXN1_9ACTN|nr:DUF805 domain-containing protein [Klenkia soli]SDO35990.1 Uncharacterized membrane protein YhaH, DUF805 family [Klenkia soli]